jgi:hypothetical protein
MPAIRELREQHGRSSGEDSGFLTLIIGAVAAFGVGALLVVGWQMLPGMIGAPGKPAPTFASSTQRLGIAAKAPLLEQCLGGMADLKPSDHYALLKMNDRAMGMARIAGARGGGPTGFAMQWGEVADCVYRQNGRMLCEPNNRALAVEAAISVVREVDAITAPQTEGSFAKTFAVANADARAAIKRNTDQLSDIKDRVLSGLRARVQDGRLIGADFGYMPPAALKPVLQDTKPTRNGCAEDGLGG